MERKSVSKSIRMTPEIFGYIDSYDGVCFNDKFANIIWDYMVKEHAYKRKCTQLEKRIQGLEKKEHRLLEEVQKLESLKDNIDSLIQSCHAIEDRLSGIEES